MDYYFLTLLKGLTFEEAVHKTKEALKKEGFGVLTEIDMKATLKKKLNVDYHNYLILGACNPPFAYEALQAENKIGTMLPCNVVVQERAGGDIEVAAVNPMASMQAVENETLMEVASAVTNKLKTMIEGL